MLAQWTREKIELYYKLFYRKNEKELSEEEKEFCRDMYILEEYACGLDG